MVRFVICFFCCFVCTSKVLGFGTVGIVGGFGVHFLSFRMHVSSRVFSRVRFCDFGDVTWLFGVLWVCLGFVAFVWLVREMSCVGSWVFEGFGRCFVFFLRCSVIRGLS